MATKAVGTISLKAQLSTTAKEFSGQIQDLFDGVERDKKNVASLGIDWDKLKENISGITSLLSSSLSNVDTSKVASRIFDVFKENGTATMEDFSQAVQKTFESLTMISKLPQERISDLVSLDSKELSNILNGAKTIDELNASLDRLFGEKKEKSVDVSKYLIGFKKVKEEIIKIYSEIDELEDKDELSKEEQELLSSKQKEAKLYIERAKVLKEIHGIKFDDELEEIIYDIDERTQSSKDTNFLKKIEAIKTFREKTIGNINSLLNPDVDNIEKYNVSVEEAVSSVNKLYNAIDEVANLKASGTLSSSEADEFAEKLNDEIAKYVTRIQSLDGFDKIKDKDLKNNITDLAEYLEDDYEHLKDIFEKIKALKSSMRKNTDNKQGQSKSVDGSSSSTDGSTGGGSTESEKEISGEEEEYRRLKEVVKEVEEAIDNKTEAIKRESVQAKSSIDDEVGYLNDLKQKFLEIRDLFNEGLISKDLFKGLSNQITTGLENGLSAKDLAKGTGLFEVLQLWNAADSRSVRKNNNTAYLRERVLVGNADSGLVSNPSLFDKRTSNRFLEEMIYATRQQFGESMADIAAHTHPENLAAFSGGDFEAFARSLKAGITKQILLSLKEVAFFDVGKFTPDQLHSLSDETQRIYEAFHEKHKPQKKFNMFLDAVNVNENNLLENMMSEVFGIIKRTLKNTTIQDGSNIKDYLSSITDEQLKDYLAKVFKNLKSRNPEIKSSETIAKLISTEVMSVIKKTISSNKNNGIKLTDAQVEDDLSTVTNLFQKNLSPYISGVYNGVDIRPFFSEKDKDALQKALRDGIMSYIKKTFKMNPDDVYKIFTTDEFFSKNPLGLGLSGIKQLQQEETEGRKKKTDSENIDENRIKDSTDNELKELSSLQGGVNEVTDSINKKTDAIKSEEDQMRISVNKELDYLSTLQNGIEEVTQSLVDKNRELEKSIDLNNKIEKKSKAKSTKSDDTKKNKDTNKKEKLEKNINDKKKEVKKRAPKIDLDKEEEKEAIRLLKEEEKVWEDLWKVRLQIAEIDPNSKNKKDITRRQLLEVDEKNLLSRFMDVGLRVKKNKRINWQDVIERNAQIAAPYKSKMDIHNDARKELPEEKSYEKLKTAMKDLISAEAELQKLYVNDPSSDKIDELRKKVEALKISVKDSRDELNNLLKTNKTALSDEQNSTLDYLDYTINNMSNNGYAKEYIEELVTNRRNTIKNMLEKEGMSEQYSSILKSALENLNKIDLSKAVFTQDDINRAKELLDIVDKLTNEAKNNTKGLKLFDTNKLRKDFNSFEGWISKNSRALSRFSPQIDQIREQYKQLLNNPGSATENAVKNLDKQVLKLKTDVQSAGLMGKSFFDIWSNRLRSLGAWLTTYVSFFDIINRFRQAISMAVNLNTQMIELSKVSEQSIASLENRFKEFRDISIDVGGTISDTISATADWSRNGYNLPDAQELSRVAQIYKNVGDGIDINEANESLISTLRGFRLEASDALSIIDKFNEVANNFPIDSAGIGDALQRSAAAFSAAHTDLSESIALVTASNSVMQDPQRVGNMWKTVSARIRGAKTELEDMGEDTENMATSVSKMRDQVMALTNVNGEGGFDIMADEENFKSIYQIIVGIGEKWDQINDVNRASLLELLAGKVQSNALAAALSNVDMLKEAYETAEDSAGSAMREQERYAQSVQYHINQFRASTEALSFSLADSGILNFFIDLGTKGVNAVTKLTDALGGLSVLGGFLGGIATFRSGGSTNFVGNLLSPISNRISNGIENTKYNKGSNALGFGDTGSIIKNIFSRNSLISEAQKVNLAKETNTILKSFKDSGAESLEAYIAANEELNKLNETSKKAAIRARDLGKESINEADAFEELTRQAKESGKSLEQLGKIGKIAFNTIANIAVSMAVSFAINKIIEAVDNEIHKFEKATEAVSGLNEKFKENSQEISSIDKEIENLNSQIDLIKQSVGKNGLTIIDKNTLSDLQAQTEELEKQKILLDAQRRYDAIEALKNAHVITDTINEQSVLSGTPEGYNDVRGEYGSSYTPTSSTRPESLNNMIDNYKNELKKYDEYKKDYINKSIDFNNTLEKNRTEAQIKEYEDSKKKYEDEQELLRTRQNMMAKIYQQTFEAEQAYKNAIDVGVASQEDVKAYKAVKQINDEYIELLADINKSTDKVSLSMENERRSVVKTKEAMEALEEEVSGVATSYNTLNTLLNEQTMSKSVELSAEQYEKYGDAIEYANGVLQLNAERAREIENIALENKIKSLTEAMEEETEQYRKNNQTISLYEQLLGDKNEAIYNGTTITRLMLDDLKAENDSIASNSKRYEYYIQKLREANGTYQDWLNAQNSPVSGTMFTDANNALEAIKEGLKTGRVGSEKYLAALDFVVPENIDKEDRSAVKKYISELEKYFKEDGEGVNYFIDQSEALGLMKKEADGTYSFVNKKADEFAEKLGLAEDVVRAMFSELKMFGWKFEWDDEVETTTADLINLRSEVEKTKSLLGDNKESEINKLTTLLFGKVQLTTDDNELDIYSQAIKDINELSNTADPDKIIEVMNALTGNGAITEDDAKALLDYASALKTATDEYKNAITNQNNNLIDNYKEHEQEIKDLKEAYDELNKDELEANVALSTLSEKYGIDIDTSNAQSSMDAIKEKIEELTGVDQIIDFSVNISELEKELDQLDPRKDASNGEERFDLTPQRVAEIEAKEGLLAFYKDLISKNEELQETQGETERVTTSTSKSFGDVGNAAKEAAPKVGDLNTAISNVNTSVNRTWSTEIPNAILSLDRFALTYETTVERIKKAGTLSVPTSSSTVIAQRNWGDSDASGGVMRSASTALVGELGRELVVDPHNGTWYTVGNNGSEFIDLPKDAIVYPHNETEQLLKRGFVFGRGTPTGKSFAYGTDSNEQTANRKFGISYVGGKAYGSGSGGRVITENDGDSSNGSKAAKNAKDIEKSTEETSENIGEIKNAVEWLDRAISSIERTNDRIREEAESENNTYADRVSYYESLLASDEDMIKVHTDALRIRESEWDRWKGLMTDTFGTEQADEFITKIEMGNSTLEEWRDSLNDIAPDDETAAKWLQLINDAIGGYDELQEVIDQLRDSEKKFHDDEVAQLEVELNMVKAMSDEIQSEIDAINDRIDYKNTIGALVTEEDYKELISRNDDIIDKYEEQIKLLERQRDLKDEGSEAYNSLNKQILDMESSIRKCRKEQAEWNEEILDIPIKRIESYISVLKDAATDLDNASSRRNTLTDEADPELIAKQYQNVQAQFEEYAKKHEALVDKLGRYDYGTEKFEETKNEIQNCESEMSGFIESMREYNKTLLQIPLNKIEKLNAKLTSIKEQVDEVNSEWELATNTVVATIDREIDGINELIKAKEEEAEAAIKPLQDQLDLMEKQNAARQRQLQLEQSQFNLAKAQQEKTIQVIRDGKIVWEANEEAIRDANQGLQDAQQEMIKAGIQDQIDAINEEKDTFVEAKNEEIEALEKTKERWHTLSDDIEYANDKAKTSEIFGESSESWVEKVLHQNGKNDDELYNMTKANREAMTKYSDKLGEQIDQTEYMKGMIDQYVQSFQSGEMTFEQAMAQTNKLIADSKDGLEAQEKLAASLSFGGYETLADALEKGGEDTNEQYKEFTNAFKAYFKAEAVTDKDGNPVKNTVNDYENRLTGEGGFQETSSALIKQKQQEYEENQKKISSDVEKIRKHLDDDDDDDDRDEWVEGKSDTGYGAHTRYNSGDHTGWVSEGFQPERYASGLENGSVGDGTNKEKFVALQALGLRKLAPDEIPAILHMGEGVINPKQMSTLLKNVETAAMNPVGLGAMNTAALPNVTISMGDLTLPNVRNGEEFAKSLQQNFTPIMNQYFSKVF